MRNVATAAFVTLGEIWGSNFIFIIPPLVALAIGWLLVDEPIDALDGAALLLILAGVLALRLGAPGGNEPRPTNLAETVER